ncbi:unnamed protein product [Echinostoma caproni]|uniref:Cnd3 domain-containing protein n=1 Tax=Echinostoma caproni TaxID=27848 RepID=A0A183AI44_9TREM|nr:unnamed protein product [Echinostoma caproni]
MANSFTLVNPVQHKQVNEVVEMISELCDPTEPPLTNDPSIVSRGQSDLSQPKAISSAAPVVTEATAKPPVLSRIEERDIRLKIAKLDVRMNELNESLHNCVLRKDFETATGLRDQCAHLEAERSALMHQLHGGPQKNDCVAHSPMAFEIQANANQCSEPNSNPNTSRLRADRDELDDDVQTAEDCPANQINRCTGSVLVKANYLAALVIQQSGTFLIEQLVSKVVSEEFDEHTMELECVVAQVIQLASVLDLSDEFGRRRLVSLVRECITSPTVPNTLSPPLLKLYGLLETNLAMRVDHVMISETALRCIIDCLLIFGFRPFHESKIRPNTAVAPTDEAAVTESEDDFDYNASDFVALVKQDDANNTSEFCRCEEMSKTVTQLIAPIVALLDSEDEDLQTCSALGLAKLLIYDRLMSSRILSDLLLLWFNPITEDRQAIRRGLACFFTDYACGNPATRTSATSAQMGNYAHQASLANSVLPTLNALIRAPASSPLSEVEPADVASLLARLTDTSHWQQQEQQPKGGLIVNPPDLDQEDVQGAGETGVDGHSGSRKLGADNPHHDRLATQLAAEVLKAPQSAEAKLYLRMLCQLHPSRNNLAVHKELLLLSDSMTKYADRSTTLLLHRFRKLINENLKALNLNPDQVLADLKRRVDSVECTPNSEGSETSHNVELDTTALFSARRLCDPSHPTLIGSARPNVHLVSPMNARGAGNRTVSVLDKSGRHMTLLNFSDDESEEDSKLIFENSIPGSSVSNITANPGPSLVSENDKSSVKPKPARLPKARTGLELRSVGSGLRPLPMSYTFHGYRLVPMA